MSDRASKPDYETATPSSRPPPLDPSSEGGEVDDRARLIDVRNLRKTFQIGLFRKKTVEAVKDVSFDVRQGEIFGFLGPNGAGKTTTIKMLTGLIAPTGGDAFLFGQRVPSASARRDLGFLPENPYVFPYLTPREFVEMSGRLSGMRGSALAKRTMEVLGKVGIAYAADRQVRRLSKGMLQRTGSRPRSSRTRRCSSSTSR
jgi:ABC-2 type transport system ATP-binding protein